MKQYDGWWSVDSYFSVEPEQIQIWYGTHCEKCGLKLELTAKGVGKFDKGSGREIERYTLACPSGKPGHSRHHWRSDTEFSYD